MNTMPLKLPLTAAAFAVMAITAPGPAAALEVDRVLVERGRYLTHVAGCNDCHTPGYAAADGRVPESLWLTGDALGWRDTLVVTCRAGGFQGD